MGTAEANSHSDRGKGLIQAVLFLSPLATAVAPRLLPFFIATVGFTLVGSALRRGIHWRELLPRSRALAACLLFAAYVLLSAAWSADPLAGVGKAALLLALILITFAAIEAATTLEKCTSRRAALAFAAGALLGTLFVAFEVPRTVPQHRSSSVVAAGSTNPDPHANVDGRRAPAEIVVQHFQW